MTQHKRERKRERKRKGQQKGHGAQQWANKNCRKLYQCMYIHTAILRGERESGSGNKRLHMDSSRSIMEGRWGRGSGERVVDKYSYQRQVTEDTGKATTEQKDTI